MLKRKRVIALFSSAIILANSTSGAINEFIVFAEDNIAPIVKENLLDSNNYKSNYEQDYSSNTVNDLGTDEQDDSSDTGNDLGTDEQEASSDTGNDLITGEQVIKPDNGGESQPLEPKFDIDDAKNPIKDNGIYYTKDDTIKFHFKNLQNIDSIEVIGGNENFSDNSIALNNNEATITLSGINKANEIINTKLKLSSVNEDSKECDLSFMYDNTTPTIEFKKDVNGSEFDKDNFDKNNVYYLDSKQDGFNLYIKTEDNVKLNAPSITCSTTDGNKDFIVTSSLVENGYYNFNISNIKGNKVNTLGVTITDLAGNKSYKEFKFFKDTAKAEVSISSDQLRLHNGIYYIKNDNSEDLVLDLEFKNVENLNVFSMDAFTDKNILINGKNVPMLLSEIKDNKATLTLDLNNLPENTNFELKFENLKDNDKDTVTSIFKLHKDTLKPEISLGKTNNDEITYAENNTLYLSYKELSAELTILNNNSDEDLLFDASIEGNEASIIPVEGTNNTFKVNVLKNTTSEVILKATDYSGNETTLRYNIIQDSNNYSELDSIMTTTFADDREFDKNNELYIYNNETSNFSFKFIFDEEDLINKFVIYKDKVSENNIVGLKHEVKLEHLANGNDFKYVLFAKNGSLNKENTYKVYYTNMYDLRINFLDKNTIIKNEGIYTDKDNVFNFNTTIIDADVDQGVENITGVNVKLLYTPFKGKPVEDNITLQPNSKYLEVGYKNVLVGKKQVRAKTYTLSKDFISNKLNFENNQLNDGKYSIEVNVESKFFNYPEEATNKSIEFYVYSSAPDATLVLNDVINNKLVAVNKNTRTYINSNDVYIGIKKENFDIKNYTENRSIKINNETYKFTDLEKSDVKFEDYILYKSDLLNELISDGNSNYKDYNFSIDLSDILENNTNTTTSKNIYTIDKKEPLFNIYAEGVYGDILELVSDVSKNKAPFINLKNLVGKFINEDNNTIDNTTVSRNRFLWFGESYTTSDNIRDIDIQKVLNITGEGFYKFKVESKDKAGNTSTKEFSFNVDTQEPKIEMRDIDIANDKAFANLDKLKVDINRKPFFARSLKNMYVSDTMDSVINLDLNLTETVTKKSYNFSATSNSPEFNIKSVEDGIYNVVLKATDEAGNTAYNNTGKITIDGSKPSVSTKLYSLTDTIFNEGSHTIDHKNVESVTPVITITDITTKPEDINITLQGRNSTKTIAVNNSNSSVDGYTRKITLPNISNEDVYDLKISVGDRIIRESIESRNHSITNIGFGIDRTKPNLSVTAGGKAITEGSTTYLNAKDTMDLIAKVSDNILSENDIKTVITLNGNSKNGTTHTFNADNTYNVNVTATDNALNSESLNFTIIRDTVIPKVTIEGVDEGTFLNKDVTPTITTDDETAVETITLNNASYKKGTVINKDNDYALVAKAEDAAGNIGEASVNFVLDKTKPVINIKNITEGGFYDEGSLTPNIEVLDNDKEVQTVIFLDGKEYTGGEISEDGKHVLSVKAVDRASNTTQQSVSFETNFNPPTITVNNIKDNQIFTGPVKLDIDFGDTKIYYIFINGKEYMNGDTISKPGKYKMEIIAKDEHGSETRQVINFTINEGVVAPSSSDDNGPTANTYKLIAVSITAILTLVLFVVFSKMFKPKNS